MKIILLINLFIFSACKFNVNEKDKNSLKIEFKKFDTLHVELMRVIKHYVDCDNISYTIDTSLFNFQVEEIALELGANYFIEGGGDSSLRNKEYIFFSPPSYWLNTSEVKDSCMVIYTGIMVSKDKTVQYATAYSKSLDMVFRIQMKRTHNNQWEVILMT